MVAEAVFVGWFMKFPHHVALWDVIIEVNNYQYFSEILVLIRNLPVQAAQFGLEILDFQFACLDLFHQLIKHLFIALSFRLGF